MHRQKTKFTHRFSKVFTSRANGVAKVLERRGIRATYQLHDRVLSNRESRRLFAQDRPELDELQRRIVLDVEAQGFSVVSFSDLFPPETWLELEALGRRFIADTETDLAAGGEHVKVREGKEFVVRLLSYGVDVGLDNPWFRVCASRRMLDLANAYLRMWSKLEYVDAWYSVPQPKEATRISSQRWHRDFNDKHLLKAFLYLVDVDEDMGPFQYISGSQPGGQYADAWRWQPLGENYPTEGELEERIPASAAKVFTAPKGTIIFCNTAGFHRGGFSTTEPRVLATVTYSSPASLASLTVQSYRFTGSLDALDEPTRFALS